MTVTGNATITADPGTFGNAPIVTANGNTSHLVVTASVANLGSLTLTGNATLDVQQNIVNLSNTALDPVSTIQGYVFGSQIISSSLTTGYAVGYGTVTVGNTTETEFRYDAKGDADLSGTVNDADLLTLLQNYGASTTLWGNGNFEATAASGAGDPPVGDADLLDLLHNYGSVVATQLQSDGVRKINVGVASAYAAALPTLLILPVANPIIGATDESVLDDSSP